MGELAGIKTTYGTDSRQMSTEVKAQQTTAVYRRVSEQARGEFAGQKTLMDASAQTIILAKNAPKTALVNNQITKVDAGVIPVDSFDLRHMKSKQVAQQQERVEKAELTGKSMFGFNSTENVRVANAPNPAAINNQIRAPNAGSNSYGSNSADFVRATNAPKRSLVNNQITGSVRGNGDASFFKNPATEWRPESEMIEVEVVVPVVEE